MAKTIEQIQQIITDGYDQRQIINELADYLQANPSSPGGGSSYLSYVALLTQFGTDAPTATVLTNTIGDIVWTREAEGLYKGTLNGAFPADKTWYPKVNNKLFNSPIEIRVYP